MMNQKSAKEAIKTTTTGTTIAGMRVPTLLDDEDLAAVEEVLLAEVEAEAAVLVSFALTLDMDARMEEYCAESVTTTADG